MFQHLIELEFFQVGPGSGMNGKNQGHNPGNPCKFPAQTFHAIGIIHIGRSVKRHIACLLGMGPAAHPRWRCGAGSLKSVKKIYDMFRS
jgi:hypothetical protein